MSWIKTPLPENPTRPLKHNPQPKAVSLGQRKASRGPCSYLMHRISCLLFSNTRPPPLELGSHHIFCVLTSLSTFCHAAPWAKLRSSSAAKSSPSSLRGNLPSSCWGFAQRKPRRGIFPSPTNPFPTLRVPLSRRMLHLRLLLDTCLSEKVVKTSPLYLSSDSGAAKLGAGWTNICCLCRLLLYCVPSISLGTEDKTVNGSIQRPFPHRTYI